MTLARESYRGRGESGTSGDVTGEVQEKGVRQHDVQSIEAADWNQKMTGKEIEERQGSDGLGGEGRRETKITTSYNHQRTTYRTVGSTACARATYLVSFFFDYIS